METGHKIDPSFIIKQHFSHKTWMSVDELHANFIA